MNWENKSLAKYLYILLISLWTIALSYANFAKGFDFTDHTLTYHFSLRILNGDIPFKDFHTTLMPLAYYIEAFFHYIFGSNLIVNTYLGFALKFLQVYFIFKIFEIFYKDSKVSIIFTMILTSLFLSQNLIYFSFTPLAITLSIINTYIALLSSSDRKYLIVFGSTTGLTFLSKQNFGMVLLIGYFTYMLIIAVKYRTHVKSIFIDSILYLLGFMLVIFPFLIYFINIGLLSEIIYILLTGSERKGLSDLNILGFINTLIPIKTFAVSLFAALITLYIFMAKSRKFITFSMSGVLLLSVIVQFSEMKFFRYALEILFYDSVKIILVALFIYFILARRVFDKNIYIVTILLSAIIFTNELSWPGRGYILPILSGLFLLLIPSFELKREFNKQYTVLLMTRLSLISVIIFSFSSFFLTKEKFYRDFNADDNFSLEPFLLNYKMSNIHKKAIIDFKQTYDQKCKFLNIFVFPWSPMIYSLLGAKNPTRFDLPYHDWLTEKEADEAIDTIIKNPPCLLIIEKASLSENGRATPFPAHGMRKMEIFFKNVFLKNFLLIESIQTYGKEHMVFIRKEKNLRR